uniref:Putative exostosin-like protein n=1 Tax=Tanacetum cinerariifolium TaxID=118510 RepID=A0A699GH59_TANCI|nr:putative exostosin-like protein [Tanacetum cinerariifolium]
MCHHATKKTPSNRDFTLEDKRIEDVLNNVLKQAGISFKKEASVNFLTDPLERRSTLRPADILVFGWAGGKHACVDLTGVSPLVGLRDNGFVAGQAALKAESSKVAKHEKACLENQHVFIPFAFDTFCFLASEAEKFLTRVKRVVQTIEESKDLSILLLDELIGNLKVYEVVLEKDSEASKIKNEKYKSLALKARKISSDKEETCSGSDEEYDMAIRDFKNLFKIKGKFVSQPYDDKKNLRKVKEEKKGKEERRCFKCDDPNHFISDCPKHSFHDQKAFVGGCWSDVLSDSLYYSSSSLDSESL